MPGTVSDTEEWMNGRQKLEGCWVDLVISHKANWLFLPIRLYWYMTDMPSSVLQQNYDRIHNVLLASFSDGLKGRFGILYLDVSWSNFRWGSAHITFSGRFGVNIFSDHVSEILTCVRYWYWVKCTTFTWLDSSNV